MTEATTPTIPLPIDTDPNVVGEILRRLIFGSELGAYYSFTPAVKTTAWDQARLARVLEDLTGLAGDELEFLLSNGDGFTCQLGELTVETCWFWDGDGTLAFQIKHDGQVHCTLVNSDCKKPNRWESHDDNQIAY